jgi:hypothetical protein
MVWKMHSIDFLKLNLLYDAWEVTLSAYVLFWFRRNASNPAFFLVIEDSRPTYVSMEQ